MTSRRNFLRIVGGGIVLAAGSAGAFLGTRTPAAALAPWDAAGGYDDPRMRALSYAILSPNPHNRQPWEVDLSVPNEITIWRDKTRNLPHTDPYDRQLTVGMGCFLELLRIAASQTGHRADATLFPQGDEGPVSIVRFSEGASADPLFLHVLARRSCKEPFAETPLTVEEITALGEYCDVVHEAEAVARLRDLTTEAWWTEVRTPRTYKESVDLMRFGKAQINENPDGIDLGGPFLDSLKLVGMLNREQLSDIESSASKQGFESYVTMLTSTPAYVTITSAGNTRLDQIDAGRRWLRLNLATTSMGLSLHPVSQALQEFPEMEPHYTAAHELLAPAGGTVQMLGRVGHGPQTPPSPRWSLETRIRDVG